MSTPPYLGLPIAVSATTLTAAHGDVAALQAGAPVDDRPPAVLVPGFTGSKEDFIAVLAPMAAAGFFVTAFDQRGQWQTTGPAAFEEYDLAGFGADLVAVASTLGDRVHVLGHSYGGLVAREAVITAPDRFASVTLLCSGPAGLPHPQRDELALFADVLDEHGLQVLWAAKSALEREQGNEGPDDPEVARFLDQRFLASSPGSLLRMARDLVDTPDRTESLRATGVPTQVVWGEDDHYWPPDLQRHMAQRLNASTVEIVGAAHSPNVEQPEALVKIVTEFWAASGAGGSQ